VKLSLALQTPEVEKRIPVALCTGSFEERLRKARGFGYDGVELMTADPGKLDIPMIRSRVKDAGLAVSAIGSGAVAMVEGLTLLAADEHTRGRAARRLGELIEAAAAFGAACVTIGSFRGRAGWMEGGNARSHLIDVLEKAAEKAAGNGVLLALEPLNRYESDIINTADEALALIGETGSGSIGVVLDTYHMNIEEPSFTGSIGKTSAAGRLFHVHLGDSNRLPPGQGHIDFPAVLAALDENGYTGYLSAELLPVPDGDLAAQRTIEHMRGLARKK
jgi:sugar phosphate isomerase/epimerase